MPSSPGTSASAPLAPAVHPFPTIALTPYAADCKRASVLGTLPPSLPRQPFVSGPFSWVCPMALRHGRRATMSLPARRWQPSSSCFIRAPGCHSSSAYTVGGTGCGDNAGPSQWPQSSRVPGTRRQRSHRGSGGVFLLSPSGPLSLACHMGTLSFAFVGTCVCVADALCGRAFAPCGLLHWLLPRAIDSTGVGADILLCTDSDLCSHLCLSTLRCTCAAACRATAPSLLSMSGHVYAHP